MLFPPFCTSSLGTYLYHANEKPVLTHSNIPCECMICAGWFLKSSSMQGIAQGIVFVAFCTQYFDRSNAAMALRVQKVLIPWRCRISLWCKLSNIATSCCNQPPSSALTAFRQIQDWTLWGSWSPQAGEPLFPCPALLFWKHCKSKRGSLLVEKRKLPSHGNQRGKHWRRQNLPCF